MFKLAFTNINGPAFTLVIGSCSTLSSPLKTQYSKLEREQLLNFIVPMAPELDSKIILFFIKNGCNDVEAIDRIADRFFDDAKICS